MMVFFREALIYLGWFALASVLGALSYGLIMRTRGKIQNAALVISFLLVALPSITLIVLTLPAVVILGVLCLYPATVERRLDGNRFKWHWYFLRLVLACYNSLIIGGTLTVLWMLSKEDIYYDDDLQLAALGTGFALTPLVLAMFRGLLHDSKLRPGFDMPMQRERG